MARSEIWSVVFELLELMRSFVQSLAAVRPTVGREILRSYIVIRGGRPTLRNKASETSAIEKKRSAGGSKRCDLAWRDIQRTADLFNRPAQIRIFLRQKIEVDFRLKNSALRIGAPERGQLLPFVSRVIG